jgi:hypothetical protein
VESELVGEGVSEVAVGEGVSEVAVGEGVSEVAVGEGVSEVAVVASPWVDGCDDRRATATATMRPCFGGWPANLLLNTAELCWY